jgi:hypothetical protein
MTPLLLTGIAWGGHGDEPVRWSAGEPQRYAIQARVSLPLFMRLDTGFNNEARMVGFDLRLVTTCTETPGPEPCETCGRGPNPNEEVLCLIDDLAFSATGMAQEKGRLQPIVTEIDEQLTGSVVQLQVRHDGRLVNIDLEGLDRRNHVVGNFIENLRLILARGFAGLDLTAPPEGDRSWVQYDSWLLRLPDAEGSMGGSEIVHRIYEETDDTITVESGGRALLVPVDVEYSANKYETRFHGIAIQRREDARLVERAWTVIGVPTASSRIAFGTAGYAYMQDGWIKALDEGETWNVGQSVELADGWHVQTAIQQGPGSSLGAEPR